MPHNENIKITKLILHKQYLGCDTW